MPDMKVVYRKNIGDLGVCISAGNYRVRCEIVHQEEVLFHFHEIKVFGGSLQKYSTRPERLIGNWNVSTEAFCRDVFSLMGIAPAKIMKLIAREAAGSA